MVIPHLFIIVLPLLAAIYHVSAFHAGVRGEFIPSRPAKRDHISDLENTKNLNYMINLTLGGQPLQALIDTGSSDMWVSEKIVAAHDTGVSSGLTYALGAVSGSIKTAQLEFLGYTVSDQAFLEASPTSNMPPFPGFLGLGPNAGSRIHASLDDQSQGDAVLDRIFRQNVSSPNILTILLGRSNDPTEKYPGNITVGEVLPGLENITSEPHVPVTSLPPLDSADQHWQVLLDEDGIIGPDGKPIQVQTKVQSTSNPKQLTAIFDTGYSFPQVPPEVSEAIYSGIPGASLQFVNGAGEIWVIPCDAEVNLAFKIGGQLYPIHPLDTNSDDALTNPDGITCLGAFQPNSPNASVDYDLVLGTSFLRNAYLLINFGDFVDGSVDTTADPYVQLLSITDPASAHADFVSVRLNHTSAPPSPSPSPSPAPAPAPAPTSPPPNHAAVDAAAKPSSSSSAMSNVKSAFLKEKIPIIIVSAVGVGLMVIGILVLCCTRNRLTSRSLASTYRSYQQLGAPAPAGEMRPVGGYHHRPPPPPQPHHHANAAWGRR